MLKVMVFLTVIPIDYLVNFLVNLRANNVKTGWSAIWKFSN